jgi:hypothetical protein
VLVEPPDWVVKTSDPALLSVPGNDNELPTTDNATTRSLVIDEQIALLVQSLKHPQDWDLAVRKILRENNEDLDPEIQRKEIREQIRRMRTAYKRGMYNDDKHLF